MKMIVLIVMLFVFSGCGDLMMDLAKEKAKEFYGELYDAVTTDRRETIEDWQDREAECLNYPDYYEDKNFVVDLDSMIEIKNRVVASIKYKPDTGNYYQTSCETEARGMGDCEDIAIAIWKELREAGFPDDIIGIGIAKNDRGQCHAFAMVYYTLDDFYILDTNFWGVVDSKLLNDSVSLIVGYNLFSIWEL